MLSAFSIDGGWQASAWIFRNLLSYDIHGAAARGMLHSFASIGRPGSAASRRLAAWQSAIFEQTSKSASIRFVRRAAETAGLGYCGISPLRGANNGLTVRAEARTHLCLPGARAQKELPELSQRSKAQDESGCKLPTPRSSGTGFLLLAFSICCNNTDNNSGMNASVPVD